MSQSSVFVAATSLVSCGALRELRKKRILPFSILQTAATPYGEP